MADRDPINPAPVGVAQLVNDFVAREKASALQYENSELLDDSSVYSLHELSRRIYAEGWQAGVRYQIAAEPRS